MEKESTKIDDRTELIQLIIDKLSRVEAQIGDLHQAVFQKRQNDKKRAAIEAEKARILGFKP